MLVIIENSPSQIGNGQRVNFWLHKWLTIPIVDRLGSPSHLRRKLEAKVADFISNRSWPIPDDISSRDLTLTVAIYDLVLPTFDIEDELRWNGSVDGTLGLKIAWNCPLHQLNTMNGLSQVWSKFIPPTCIFSCLAYFS